MSEEAVDFFRVLVEAGAIPGEDFSCSAEERTCRVSERAYRLLKQNYPERDWDSVSQTVSRNPREAVEAIQAHLGIDFVDRILDRMTYRLGELPASKTTWYLKQILYGVEQKTSVPLYDLFMKGLSFNLYLYAQRLLEENATATPCGEWIGDLVLAAGGSADDFELHGEEALLTEQGMRLLAEVWLGEFDLYAELARND